MSYHSMDEMQDIDRRAPLGCEALVEGKMCRKDVVASFGLCSAKRSYVLVCTDHDLALNRALLTAIGMPNVNRKIAAYRRYRLPKIAENWRATWIRHNRRAAA